MAQSIRLNKYIVVGVFLNLISNKVGEEYKFSDRENPTSLPFYLKWSREID